MRKNLATRKYYRDSVKHLSKELQGLNRLKSVLDDFVESKRNGVIQLDTFHLIAAAQILRNGIPILSKGIQKNIGWYRRRLK